MRQYLRCEMAGSDWVSGTEVRDGLEICEAISDCDRSGMSWAEKCRMADEIWRPIESLGADVIVVCLKIEGFVSSFSTFSMI
jgi:hypothetical protein